MRIWNILAIDDDPVDVDCVKETLRMRPITVSTVTHVNDAIHFMERQGTYVDAPWPHLILLDLRLPIIAGTVFLEERQRRKRWRDIPVVVLSSAWQARARCLALGADDCIRKPCRWDEWQAVMDNLVDRHLRYQ